MPTTWADLLELGERETAAADADGTASAATGEEPGARRGIFRRLRESLATSRQALGAELGSSLFENLDAEAWERLEEALIMADVGARTTAEVVNRLEGEVDAGQGRGGRGGSRPARRVARRPGVGRNAARSTCARDPAIVLIVGVNGTGKTTTVGKLAWHLQKEAGLSVMLAAADTYRAAAVEQLETWAGRAGCEIVKARMPEAPRRSGRRNFHLSDDLGRPHGWRGAGGEPRLDGLA